PPRLPYTTLFRSEREIRISRERVEITERNGVTEVRVQGAVPELRPGLPDLPVLAERVDLPQGTRVRALDVLGLERQELPGRAWIPPARAVRPGELSGA